MSEEVEISEFIGECVRTGKGTRPQDINKAALERIQEIDKLLLEADKLRPEKAKLIRVIKSFGFDVPKASRRPIPILNEESTQDDLDPKLLEHAFRIVGLLEESGPVSNRELMTLCGVTPDHDFEVYAVIKWLCSSGICVRTDPDRLVARGPNWDARPIREE